ncbi:DUF427 domain-containing protein [Erythrobacter litoralis]|uniref:DUF427 domain-containing protein n=1 Tax=Erythrobacter litoralis (strain HTCC2594) TaxID=314225 RepID=Q2N8F9_ERYLH|nr:DUF427 domain-containing protein [Erythrobacter litoralis]ABC64032.1 hypothetical protein ELI_09700 [Erythrobacter litoralis HTCC2594]
MIDWPDLPDKRALLARVRGHRSGWDAGFRPPNLEKVGSGEESVWDYPRPPRLDPAPATVTVRQDNVIVAKSDRALDLKETAGAPCPYLPPADVETEWLVPNGRISLCEWKGAAVEFDLAMPGQPRVTGAAWSYPDPFDDLAEDYSRIAGWIAFYPSKLACFVGDERARPQPGGLYGGWITDRIKGPVKGEPGTGHW